MNTINRHPCPSPAERASERAGWQDVFAALELSSAVDVDGLTGVLRASAPLADARDPAPLDALLSQDGRRLLCRWRRADPNVVAEALARAGLTPATLWTGTVLELADDRIANVVVEDNRDVPIRSIFPYDRIGTCLVNHRVAPVRVAISMDGRHLLAFYHAPDAESVRLAQRHGSVCAGRIWSFQPVRSG